MPVKFMTVDQVRKKLCISTRTAYRLVKEKKIPGAFKVGGTWRFREDLFYRWIEEETAPSDGQQGEVLKGV